MVSLNLSRRLITLEFKSFLSSDPFSYLPLLPLTVPLFRNPIGYSSSDDAAREPSSFTVELTLISYGQGCAMCLL